MTPKEQQIKTTRLVEATRKGIADKLMCILNNLGKPILNSTSGDFYNETEALFLDWQDIEEPEMPTLDLEDEEHACGLHFDGLSQGLHLEITYFPEDKRVTLWWKGNKVFLEQNNELEVYCPNKDWEEPIQRLFDVAKKRQTKNRLIEKEENKEKIKREKLSYLAELRKKWGF